MTSTPTVRLEQLLSMGTQGAAELPQCLLDSLGPHLYKKASRHRGLLFKSGEDPESLVDVLLKRIARNPDIIRNALDARAATGRPVRETLEWRIGLIAKERYKTDRERRSILRSHEALQTFRYSDDNDPLALAVCSELKELFESLLEQLHESCSRSERPKDCELLPHVINCATTDELAAASGLSRKECSRARIRIQSRWRALVDGHSLRLSKDIVECLREALNLRHGQSPRQ